MNKILSFVIGFACLSVTSSAFLSAYTIETVDSTTVTQDWPEIYQFLIKNEYESFRTALFADRELAKSKAPNGFNLLEFAILARAPNEVLQTILVSGADVNKLRDIFVDEGWIASGHAGDASFRTSEYRTPLFAAFSIGDNEIMQLLLNYGADINKVLYERIDIEDHYDGHRSGRESITYWFSLHELLEDKYQADAAK
ncbi:MAG TPA: hypothetical protein VGP47_03955 [Parachlamydiaceae bacterium]|nr:hypothetical protein [Parachlamydiaceae bacterium]